MSSKRNPQAELEAFIDANPELGDDETRKAFWEQRVSKDPALMRAIYDDVRRTDPAWLRALIAGFLADKPTSRVN
jgi:hypothetical protein